MPITPTYPGVYIEEIPSGVRTITGVATSITAFIGRTRLGLTDEPITINSFGDFERIFGGLWEESALSFAVRDFYLNGGSQAIIVRLFNPTSVPEGEEAPRSKSKVSVAGIELEAASEGTWAQNLRATVDLDVSPEAATQMGLNASEGNEKLFNLTIRDITPNGIVERFSNLTVISGKLRSIDVVLTESKLVRWTGAMGTLSNEIKQLPTLFQPVSEARAALRVAKDANPPVASAIETAEENLATALKNLRNATDDKVSAKEKELEDAKIKLRGEKNKLVQLQNASPPIQDAINAQEGKVNTAQTAVITAKQAVESEIAEMGGNDGDDLTSTNFLPTNGEQPRKGLYSLLKTDLFNLLCIPPYTDKTDNQTVQEIHGVLSAAAKLCQKQRAFLLVDAPSTENKTSDAARDAIKKFKDGLERTNYAAIFFPRLMMPNPLRENQMEEFAACGAMAGIFARTDAQRGVWKAPAGTEATLTGVPQLSVPLTDPENGELNKLGINCLRAFPVEGRIVWGSRTLRGDDQLSDEYKYIPVRRLALYIEESLYRGTQWVVFEPNDEPLWAQIRLNIGAFMNNLFRQGAFQGRTPQEAYFVKCSSETTIQNDINLGIVNIIVGFAPLKPAEFVVIKFQQIAGQIAT